MPCGRRRHPRGGGGEVTPPMCLGDRQQGRRRGRCSPSLPPRETGPPLCHGGVCTTVVSTAQGTKRDIFLPLGVCTVRYVCVCQSIVRIASRTCIFSGNLGHFRPSFAAPQSSTKRYFGMSKRRTEEITWKGSKERKKERKKERGETANISLFLLHFPPSSFSSISNEKGSVILFFSLFLS